MTASNKDINDTDHAGIGIIGCGWLGTALAKKLQQQHYRIKVTTATAESAESLNKEGIDAHELSLPLSDSILPSLGVFTMHTLVICIPPRFKRGLKNYAEKMGDIVALAEKYEVKKLIMISSTAIYNGLSGAVDENSLLDFTASKVQLMHDAEQEILAFKGQKNILRLSGLVGPKRHPGRFLSGDKLHKNGSHEINLIHQSDAVGLIISLIKQSQPNAHCSRYGKNENEVVFNGVSSTQSTRDVFYQCASQALGLPSPNFEKESVLAESTVSSSKKVVGMKAVEKLKYDYLYANLLTWVKKNTL